MYRASVKNTFLDFIPREDQLPSSRSRSTGPTLTTRRDESAEDQEASIERLNDFLNTRTAPEPISWRRSEEKVQAMEDHSGTPSVDELLELQRRLSELTGVRCSTSSTPKFYATSPQWKPVVHRVRSSSSMSTVDISDAEDISCMKQVWSSDSVNTMVSEIIGDEFEDRGAGRCSPTIYEEVQDSMDGSQDGFSVELGPTRSVTCRQCPKDFSHSRVPRSVNLAEEFSKYDHEAPPTTMMIRNIPNRYTQRELIKELESLGFTGEFDFLYLPMDKATLCNVGYSFVNFIEPSAAARCMQIFENYTFRKHRKARGKVATVSVAHIQGLEANARHYENAAVNGANRSRQRGPVIMTRLADALEHPATP